MYLLILVNYIFFTGIKKKLADAVDGSSGSKPVPSSKETKTEANNEHSSAENAFDQVERRPLLSDVRATRAKAPGKITAIDILIDLRYLLFYENN